MSSIGFETELHLILHTIPAFALHPAVASRQLFQGGGQVVGRGEPRKGLLGTRDLRRSRRQLRQQQLRQQWQEVAQRRGLVDR